MVKKLLINIFLFCITLINTYRNRSGIFSVISHLNFSLYSLEYVFLEIDIFLYCLLNDRYLYALFLGS